MTILNGQTLLTTAMSGLASTYTTVMNGKTSTGQGLTMKDFSELSPQAMMNLGTNNTFLQYMSANFKNFDKDGDGEISSNDLQNVMTTMQSKGLTYNEIQQLCTTGNYDKSLLSTVLTYFNKIDANGDGRITSDEITKFSYDTQRNEVEEKYKSYKASSVSLYYNEGIDDDTSSVLDSLRPNLNSTST